MPRGYASTLRIGGDGRPPHKPSPELRNHPRCEREIWKCPRHWKCLRQWSLGYR